MGQEPFFARLSCASQRLPGRVPPAVLIFLQGGLPVKIRFDSIGYSGPRPGSGPGTNKHEHFSNKDTKTKKREASRTGYAEGRECGKKREAWIVETTAGCGANLLVLSSLGGTPEVRLPGCIPQISPRNIPRLGGCPMTLRRTGSPVPSLTVTNSILALSKSIPKPCYKQYTVILKICGISCYLGIVF
jgi:hypothetical protein